MSRWEIRIATLIGALVVGFTPSATTAAEQQPGLATAVLETLAVKGRAPKTGYTRAQFGQAWADVDRNGCDTRNDMLKRDLTGIIYKAGTRNCVVASGVLVDRYSGETINFRSRKCNKHGSSNRSCGCSIECLADREHSSYLLISARRSPTTQ